MSDTVDDEWAERVNAETSEEVADAVRQAARDRLGGNCTYSIDDVFLMGILAQRAVLAGLHVDCASKRTRRIMESAAEMKRAEHERALGFAIAVHTNARGTRRKL